MELERDKGKLWERESPTQLEHLACSPPSLFLFRFSRTKVRSYSIAGNNLSSPLKTLFTLACCSILGAKESTRDVSGGSLLWWCKTLVFIIFSQAKLKRKWGRLTKPCTMTGVWCPNTRRRPSRNSPLCLRRLFSSCRTHHCSGPWSLHSGRRRENQSWKNQLLIWRRC